MGTIYTIQHQVCTSDSNGNPRRLWYVSKADTVDEEGTYALPFRIIDEGYDISTKGEALKRAGLGLDVQWIALPTVAIPPGEYRDLLELGERLDPNQPWRVVWADGGEHYAFAPSKAKAQRIADQYNRPYRNDERPIRVHVIANG